MALQQVNNDIYRTMGHAWWDDNEGEFSTIRFFVNPVRFAFFKRVLEKERCVEQEEPHPKEWGHERRTVLDVGCGGGILAEEFARSGFEVTGIDPAPETIETAQAHAASSGLTIQYTTGSGESLPFPDASFDIVVCCDVLEHVSSPDQVVGEIARVLRPQGAFLYDTINRTLMSKIGVIKVMQEWPSTAFAAPNSHVWDRFIKPEELASLLRKHGLENRVMRGISTHANPVSAWLNFRRRAQGKISFKELGQRLQFHESSDLHVSYMGYALKRGNPS